MEQCEYCTVFTTFDHIAFLKRTLLQSYGTLLHAEYCIELVFATVRFNIAFAINDSFDKLWVFNR